MADQTSTLKIGAEVEGAPSIKDLTAAYQQMTAGVQNFSSLLARVRPAAAAPDQPKNLGQKVISAAGNLGMEGLRGAANVAGGAIKSAASSLLSFAGPLSNVAMASLTTAPTAIAAGLALVAVVPFVFNLGVTYNLMRRSWKWANDSMQKQFDVAYRTRRTFPGIIGDEFARITPYVKARMGMTSALFGEAAASMEDMITRRLTPERLMRGVRGEKDLFSSVGITPGFIQQMERMKGQSLNVGGRARLDLTDWLAIFIKKREALEGQILAAPEGSTLRQLLQHRKSQMLDKSLRVFNARFADLASFMTMEDLQKLGDQSRASTGLNVITKESVKNAAEFRLAVGTTREIFYQLKMGIGREVQPVITRIMTDLSDWLLPIREDGQSMAMNLRNLGAALAIKGWEVMEALIRRINPQTVRKLMDRMKQWRPEGSIKILMFLARELQYLAEGLVTTLLVAAKALKMVPTPKEAKGRFEETFEKFGIGGTRTGAGYRGGLFDWGAGGTVVPGGGGGYLGGGRGSGSPSGTGYLNDSGVGPGGDWTPSPESGAGSFRAGAQQRMNYFQMQGKGPYERSQLSTVKTPFGKVAAHPQAEADVAGFFNELQTHGAPIKKLGSYNKRRMRRGSMWSSHGYGVAFDLDDAQYLSPEMKAWIKRNPDKWSEAKKRWNMSQMQSTESTGGTGGWDPGHVEWVGPAGKQAPRGPGQPPGAVVAERGAPSPFGPVPTVTPEGQIITPPPGAVQPAAITPISAVSAGPTVRPTGAWGGKTVNENVLQARIRQANDQWLQNPKNQQLVYRLMQAEGGPQNVGANLEQMSNYAAAHGKTIQQVMEARGERQYYGPMRRLQTGGLKPHERDAFHSPWTEAKQKVWDDARRQVFEGGSNRIDYRTMQGMKGDPNWQKLDVDIGGNRFGIQPGTEKWVRAQRTAPPASVLVPPPYTSQAPVVAEAKVEEAVLRSEPPPPQQPVLKQQPTQVWPTTGTVGSQFGMRRHPVTGKMTPHKGIDISGGNKGQPVVSTGGGVVVRSGWAGGYGNFVEIKRKDGSTERYGHMIAPSHLKVGQTVGMGERIGNVGSTGQSTGPHLHYERRDAKGNPININEEFGGRGTRIVAGQGVGMPPSAMPVQAPAGQPFAPPPTTVTATIPVSYTQNDLYKTVAEMTGLSPDVAQQLASTPEGHAKIAKYMKDKQIEEDRLNKRGAFAPVTPEDVANLKELSDQLASGKLTAADLAKPAVWKDAEKVKGKERELFKDAIDRMEAKDREALKAREDLVKPAIDVQKPAIEEGTAAGKAATKAFKDGIKDVKIPVKSLTEEEKNRDQKAEEKEKEAEAA